MCTTPSTAPAEPGQAAVIAFLADPASYTPRPESVDRIETHGAIVFLASDVALKIKRAVKLSYLDFSTLEKRHAFCLREIEINRPNAPDIYRDVVAVTRESDGALAIGGKGAPIEWAVRMARFSQDDLLSNIAARETVGAPLASALAAMIDRAHAAAPVLGDADSTGHLGRILDSVADGMSASARDVAGIAPRIAEFRDLGRRRLARAASILARRAAAGLVRRCHGDMHTGNIVLWKGEPQLFDAIEFDEALASIDLLYDLAFLLMDLDRRGQREAARLVLDRYLSRSGRDLDLEGLVALPLFLGLRAAVRAMVAFDRARVQSADERSATERHAVETLDLALAYLEPQPPRLIAVGGLSGTGKTTLAAALAPLVLPAPGALHLRSDVLRKSLAGVGEFDRLPASAYTPEARANVYAELFRRARLALAAGHSVVVDAVFASPDERQAIEHAGKEGGANFDGLWLEAPADVMQARVAARHGDASDATPAVVRSQLAADPGPITWHHIAATGEPDRIRVAALAALGLGEAHPSKP